MCHFLFTLCLFDSIIKAQINYSLNDTMKGVCMGNYYSYRRISTDQKHQNFNRQIKALDKYALEKNIEYLVEFVEEKSAKNFDDRPQFNKLDKLLQADDTAVFKDIERFTRDDDVTLAYKKYMEWFARGINIVFIDNPTLCTDYIKEMMRIASEQDIVTRTAMESIIKLLIIVELDRAKKQRLYISKSITDGIRASEKKSGRKEGQLDKLTEPLQADILMYLGDRTITQVELMKKHDISRNTLKKYISYMKEQHQKKGE